MKRRILGIQIVIAILMAFANTLFAEGRGETVQVGSEAIRIFIVHSYEEDHVCGAPQGRGIEASLVEQFKKRIRVQSHFMNTKTINSAPEKMKQEALTVLREVNAFKPHIVFTLDDDAFREVGLKLKGQDYPVIFSGLNGQPKTYSNSVPFLDGEGLPSSNITGIYEKLHLQTALNVMKGVIPDLKKVVALLDMTSTGKAIRIQMEDELRNYGEKVEVVFIEVGTMKDYLREITKINQDGSVQAVYPVVLSVVDDTARSVGFKTTIKAFIENCRKPGMALNFDFARLGLFGGASVDFEAMGRQAGGMGVKYIKGMSIRELPVESAEKYLITFNKGIADRLNVKIPDELIGAAIIYDSIALLAKSE